MRFLILPGDGIGPEIVPVAAAALAAIDRRFGLGIEMSEEAIGLASLATENDSFPDAVLDKARDSDGVVMGPTHTMVYPPPEEGGRTPSAVIRKQLDLYANIRPARTRPGIPSAVENMDLVFARENTEGFYADRNMFEGSAEFLATEDVAISARRITRQASERIAETACALAAGRRRKVTVVTKKNVLALSDGLFHNTVMEVAARHPGIETEHVLIDAMAALLVRTPERFDVVCLTNMYGDILSDLGSELAGSLGLGGSINASETHVLAQAAHGSAPDISGQDRANPTAMVLSCAMMLEWLATRQQRADLKEAAVCLEAAVDAQLADPGQRTADLGGPLGTRAFGERLVARIEDGG